jgi:aminoglycoside N3'-acetyltransferase
MHMTVTMATIRDAISAMELSGHPVCIHASLRSFGWVEGGAQTVIEALLAEGCTVLVLTLSFAFASPPPLERRLIRNGEDYTHYSDQSINCGPIYSPDTQEMERGMVGAIPAAVVAMPERIRGNHPRDSFTGVGPMASQLISGQSALDVYSPLRKLAQSDGFVALMGVGLDKMTLLHLAEKQAGRTLFRRWANSAAGEPLEVEEGGCSRGFVQLEPPLSPLATCRRVGKSLWRVFSAEATLEAAAEAIRRDPMITHCGNAACLECRDAVLGGPVLTPV